VAGRLQVSAHWGLLLIVFGIVHQLPWTGLSSFIPFWAILFSALNDPLPTIVLSVVLLRFPERRLQKGHERIFITVMAIWLLTFGAIRAATWPCWASRPRGSGVAGLHQGRRASCHPGLPVFPAPVQTTVSSGRRTRTR
jgi:hypothetical protein